MLRGRGPQAGRYAGGAPPANRAPATRSLASLENQGRSFKEVLSVSETCLMRRLSGRRFRASFAWAVSKLKAATDPAPRLCLAYSQPRPAGCKTEDAKQIVRRIQEYGRRTGLPDLLSAAVVRAAAELIAERRVLLLFPVNRAARFADRIKVMRITDKGTEQAPDLAFRARYPSIHVELGFIDVSDFDELHRCNRQRTIHEKCTPPPKLPTRKIFTQAACHRWIIG